MYVRGDFLLQRSVDVGRNDFQQDLHQSQDGVATGRPQSGGKLHNQPFRLQRDLVNDQVMGAGQRGVKERRQNGHGRIRVQRLDPLVSPQRHSDEKDGSSDQSHVSAASALNDLAHGVQSRMAQVRPHQVLGDSPRFGAMRFHVDHDAQNVDEDFKSLLGDVSVAQDGVQALQAGVDQVRIHGQQAHLAHLVDELADDVLVQVGRVELDDVEQEVEEDTRVFVVFRFGCGDVGVTGVAGCVRRRPPAAQIVDVGKEPLQQRSDFVFEVNHVFAVVG